ncbi:MAG: hypothetical protein RL189_988 [Pseudomonadota bacterium]|jgi:transposase-like protein
MHACIFTERRKHLCVGPYERSDERIDRANDFTDRTLKTRVGELNLKLPQVRSGNFFPSLLVKGLRSERALAIAIGISSTGVLEILDTALELGEQEACWRA